ncbi:hypothetical protein PO909_009000 [Leuciscus waleckii]
MWKSAASPLPLPGLPVLEPATADVIEGVLMELEGSEDSPAHNPAAVCESDLVSGGHFDDLKDLFEENLIDWFGEVISNTPESPAPPVSPAFPEPPAFPVSPAPSVSPASPGSPVCPPNLPAVPHSHLHWCPSAPLHLQHAARICLVSSGHQLQHRGSPGSASSLCAYRSTTACRHNGFALASPSLGSTGNHRPYCSTGFPRPSGFTLVGHRPSCTFGSI